MLRSGISCHPDPEFSKPDPVPYLFQSALCQLLPTHVCQGAYKTPSVRAAYPEPDFRSDPEFLAIRTRNFPNWFQFLTFSGRSYANFCLLMCVKVRIRRLRSRLHIRNRIFAQIRNFLPSGPGIFQTGSSSLPFPVGPMPTSAYSCVPRCV